MNMKDIQTRVEAALKREGILVTDIKLDFNQEPRLEGRVNCRIQIGGRVVFTPKKPDPRECGGPNGHHEDCYCFENESPFGSRDTQVYD